MDYQLFETGYSESEQISGGEIGSRPTGMLEFGSNYYVLLGENSITLKETITLKNSGNSAKSLLYPLKASIKYSTCRINSSTFS